jgi:hypothetical protein
MKTKLPHAAFGSLSEIKAAVKAERRRAKRAAEREKDADYPLVQSRGTFLCTADDGGQCDPRAEAECPEWRGTGAEIEDAILRCESHPDWKHVTSLYIAGGYDLMQSLRPDLYMDVIPQVSLWDVEVWRRDKCYQLEFPAYEVRHDHANLSAPVGLGVDLHSLSQAARHLWKDRELRWELTRTARALGIPAAKSIKRPGSPGATFPAHYFETLGAAHEVAHALHRAGFDIYIQEVAR